jgi:hypothetical protein
VPGEQGGGVGVHHEGGIVQGVEQDAVRRLRADAAHGQKLFLTEGMSRPQGPDVVAAFALRKDSRFLRRPALSRK